MTLEPKIEFIDEDNLSTYEWLILPGVVEEMKEDIDYYVAFGIKVSDIETGAIVAEIDLDQDVSIVSLYVTEDVRRCGIGTLLITHLLSAISHSLDYELQSEEDEFAGFVTEASYALPEEEAKAMDSFFKAVGFTDFLELGLIYTYRTDSVRKQFGNVDKRAVIPISRLEDEQLEMMGILAHDEDTYESVLLADADISFVTLVDKEPSSAFIVREVSDNFYHVLRFVGDARVGMRDVIACAKASIDKMEEKSNQSASLMFEVAGNDKATVDFLIGTLGKPEKISVHNVAAMDVEVLPKE